MKKQIILGLVILSLFLIAGCSNKYRNENTKEILSAVYRAGCEMGCDQTITYLENNRYDFSNLSKYPCREVCANE